MEISNCEKETIIDVEEEAMEDVVEIDESEEEAASPQSIMRYLQSLLKDAKGMLDLQENIWNQVRDEFEIDSNQMKPIIDYNEAHMVTPDGVDLNDFSTFPDGFDFFNGLDNIPEEKIIEVFGKECKIHGVEYSQTVDRIKWAAQTFRDYITSMFDFNNISKEYSSLIEEQEKLNIQSLQDAISKLEDGDEKKEELKNKLSDYYYFRELQFVGDELNDATKNHIINTFGDGRKIQYLIERSRDKLKRLKVSEKFILEIASFEQLYLPEKYHIQNNLLLLYFMNMVVYNDLNSADGRIKRKVLSMVVGVDKYIRKGFSNESDANVIINNIIKLEDKFLGEIDSVEK